MPGQVFRLLAPGLWERLEDALESAPLGRGTSPLAAARSRVAWGASVTGALGLAVLLLGLAVAFLSVIILLAVNLASGRLDASGTGTGWSVTVWRFRAYGSPADVLVHYAILGASAAMLLAMALRPYVLELLVGLVLAIVVAAVWWQPGSGLSGFPVWGVLAALGAPAVVSLVLRLPLAYYGMLWLLFLFPVSRASATGLNVTEGLAAWFRFLFWSLSGAIALYQFLSASLTPPPTLPFGGT